ncbi:MAG: DUF192 domain-containing protein [Patescibacteria group bacterium]
MKKKLFLIIILAVILIGAAGLFLFSSIKPIQGSVCFDNSCFEVEVVKNPIELAKGLMFRKNLEQNKGTLFVFEKEGIYPFWMKNTLIPLDIIWIDENKKIVFIKENVQPCKSLVCLLIMPTENAKYVLELNAGQAKKSGIKTGDIAKISY